MTVGRATSTGANNTNSTNIVSNVSPLTLPNTNPAYYISGVPSLGGNPSQNASGHSIDTPGAGTFYYTIWMSSSNSHTYSEMAAMLTVLKIQN
jgi:hypothetical protein